MSDAVVLLNREQGGLLFHYFFLPGHDLSSSLGEQMLEQKGILLHSIFTISDVLECLSTKDKISEKMVLKVNINIKN